LITFIKFSTFLLQRVQYLIHFGVSFKYSDEVSVLIVQSQQGGEFDAVERSEEIFDIPANMEVLVFVQIELLAKIPDLIHGLESRHHDLYIPEFIDVFSEYLGLLTAMVAIRTEKHYDHGNTGPEVPVGEPAGTVFL
jgi:hypothetical protein